jgi:cytochrome o ubiquinol oxidase subunit 1
VSGVLIGLLAIAFGFGIVWHMVWLALGSFLVIIIVLIIRLTSDDNETTISAREVEEAEKERGVVYI